MSNIYGLDEEVFPMPAVKFKSLELTADAFLEECAPESVANPSPLDAWRLINCVLPKMGVHVHSASVAQLGNCEAVTMPDGERETQILLREDVYEALEHGGRRANRPESGSRRHPADLAQDGAADGDLLGRGRVGVPAVERDADGVRRVATLADIGGEVEPTRGAEVGRDVDVGSGADLDDGGLVHGVVPFGVASLRQPPLQQGPCH